MSGNLYRTLLSSFVLLHNETELAEKWSKMCTINNAFIDKKCLNVQFLDGVSGEFFKGKLVTGELVKLCSGGVKHLIFWHFVGHQILICQDTEHFSFNKNITITIGSPVFVGHIIPNLTWPLHRLYLIHRWFSLFTVEIVDGIAVPEFRRNESKNLSKVTRDISTGQFTSNCPSNAAFVTTFNNN